MLLAGYWFGTKAALVVTAKFLKVPRFWHGTVTLLTCYWHVTDTLLTRYWHVTDTFLTRYLQVTDTLLTRYWHVTDTLLARCRLGTNAVLVVTSMLLELQRIWHVTVTLVSIHVKGVSKLKGKWTISSILWAEHILGYWQVTPHLQPRNSVTCYNNETITLFVLSLLVTHPFLYWFWWGRQISVCYLPF